MMSLRGMLNLVRARLQEAEALRSIAVAKLERNGIVIQFPEEQNSAVSEAIQELYSDLYVMAATHDYSLKFSAWDDPTFMYLGQNCKYGGM